jgi:hypothetical protein
MEDIEKYNDLDMMHTGGVLATNRPFQPLPRGSQPCSGEIWYKQYSSELPVNALHLAHYESEWDSFTNDEITLIDQSLAVWGKVVHGAFRDHKTGLVLGILCVQESEQPPQAAAGNHHSCRKPVKTSPLKRYEMICLQCEGHFSFEARGGRRGCVKCRELKVQPINMNMIVIAQLMFLPKFAYLTHHHKSGKWGAEDHLSFIGYWRHSGGRQE